MEEDLLKLTQIFTNCHVISGYGKKSKVTNGKDVLDIRLLVGRIIYWYLEDNLATILALINVSAITNCFNSILIQKSGKNWIQRTTLKAEEILRLQL